MKFIIEQQQLVGPLRKLASTAPDAASLNASIPNIDAVNAVASILIEPEQDGIRFTATDNTLRLAFRIPVEGEDLKPCTVPAKTLLRICSRFPAEARISFTLDESGKAIKLQHGRSNYTLVVVGADEFPGIASQDTEYELSISEGDLRALFSNVRYAMAQNDMRYYLLGVLLEVAPESVTAVATDGHRMAVAEHPLETGIKEKVQMIVPRKGVDELVNILTDQRKDVTLHLAGNHLRLELPGDRCAFNTMLVDGKYPDYRIVVPQERKIFAEVDREALIFAAERILSVTDELTQAVTLGFTESDVLDVVASNNKGDIGQEQIEMKVQRDQDAEKKVTISFNINYLIEALQALHGSSVMLGVTDKEKSMQITSPAGGGKHIIMPMKA